MKTDNTKAVLIRMPVDLAETIESLAEAELRSVSKQIIILLKKALEKK